MPLAAPALNTDPRRYPAEGYCVFRDAVPPAVIDSARVELDRLMAANPDTRPEYLTEPHAKHAAWLELEARQVPIELEPGEFSLHDSYAVHGSEVNASDRRRAGYTMRYANSNTVRVEVAKHWAPVFLVSGRDVPDSGYVDLRPGVPL